VGIEDLTGSFEVVVFPKVFDKFKDILTEDALVAIRGKFSLRDGEKPTISADNMELMEDKTSNNDNAEENHFIEEIEVVKPKKLCLKYNISDGIIHNAVTKILGDYNGIDEVYIRDTGTNKAYKLNTLVTVRESLLYELKTILDEENIIVQE